MEQLDLSAKQKIAGEEHRKFVDFMHPYFGLKNHPGYCKVIVRPLFLRGYFGRDYDEIGLSDYLEKNEIKYITWHESAHYLHPFSRQENLLLKDSPKRNIFLAEVVANLGALIFLDENYGLSSENIKKYFAGNRKRWIFNEDELTSLVIAKRNKDLLARMVNSDMNKVRRIFTPYRKEARIYLNSLCKNVSLMEFSGLDEAA